MGPKLLFVIGIVVAHGCLAASLVNDEPPKQRASISTCVRAPSVLPHYAPPRELLARVDISIVDLGVRQR